MRMMEILVLLFSCLSFTYFCVEAFSYVSGETSVQTSFLTFPQWFFSKAQCQGFLVHQEYLWLFSFLLFSNVPPASLFCRVKFVVGVCFGLENKLSLSAVWVYSGFLTVALDFGEASRQFVVGNECVRRGQRTNEVAFDNQNVEK